MKSAIIYYSYSGNTKQVACVLQELLGARGAVDMVELVAQDESSSFLSQCKRAFSHARAVLGEVNIDVSAYDVVCFGTPIWAFGPAPAMNAYLDKCIGIGGKDVVLFSTYGSGAGKNRSIKYMQDILIKKGAKNFKVFGVQQFKIKDKSSVLASIKEIMPLWSNG
jgi:flavodoxin